jgi:hypothetical protein
MNNEFEWRSQMKKLGESVEPANDLWPGIAARIAQEEARPAVVQRRWMRAVAAIAATFVIATGASLLALRSDRTPSTPSSPPGAAQVASTQNDSAPTAFDWAQPSDPKLAAAARDLDRANADLQAALDAHPDAVFLVSMINRTNAQRMRLMRQTAISG